MSTNNDFVPRAVLLDFDINFFVALRSKDSNKKLASAERRNLIGFLHCTSG
jgi:hypothetical protein